MTVSGYESAVVVEFACSQMSPDERHINDVRMIPGHLDMIGRWACGDVVALEKVDSFLLRYDLMLFELEDWALERFGRTGYIGEDSLQSLGSCATIVPTK